MPMMLKRIVGRRPQEPAAEDLETRRKAEREFVKAYDTTETDLWYLIHADWLADWKSFLCGNGPLPGPVRNERLIDSSTGKPHRGLFRIVDYRGVNATVWDFLQQRYGGGPAVLRKSIDIYSEVIEDITSESPLLNGGCGDRSCSPSQRSAWFRRSRTQREPADCRRFSRSRSGSLQAREPEAPQLARAPPDEQPDRDGSVYFVREANAKVEVQPADGSCLFHALSHGLNDKGASTRLRLEISKHMVDHPDMLVAGTPLAEWVKHDCGDAVSAYAVKMAGDSWGGGIEMEVAAQLKGVNVHVFEKCAGGFKRICCFDAGDETSRTVNVLYQSGNHYDALDLQGNAGEWVPRASVDDL